MHKRLFIQTTAALAAALALGSAHAQSTPIKFQLDWRFEGPAATGMPVTLTRPALPPPG